jgi:hypothetical protein
MSHYNNENGCDSLTAKSDLMEVEMQRVMIGLMILASIMLLSGRLNAQDSPWSATPNWISSYPAFTMSVALEDVDNDNKLELITGNYRYPYDFPPGHPEAFGETMGEAQVGTRVYAYDWTGSTFNDMPAPFTYMDRCIDDIALADYDKDGDLDLAIAAVVGKGKDGGVWVLKNRYDTTNPPAFKNLFVDDDDPSHRWYCGESYDAHCVRWVDVDCDGDLDLAVLEIPGTIHFYLNSGDGEIVYGFEFKPHDGLHPLWHFTTLEFGDMDRDGDPDLFVNIRNSPRVYKNTFSEYGPSNHIFDASVCWTYDECPTGPRHNEDMFCASFGFFNGQTNNLALAVGSFDFRNFVNQGPISEYNTWGNDVYTLNDAKTSLQHSWQSEVHEQDGPRPQPVTDIQWAHLDNDLSSMDLVACSYALKKSDGSWDRGLEQIHLNPTPNDFNNTIWTTVPDRSTSLALGDIDQPNANNSSEICHCWSNGAPIGWTYLSRFPAFKIHTVRWATSQEATSWTLIPSDSWCANPKEGWISVSRSYLDSLAVPPSDFWLKVSYAYSLEYDLAVGNDGKNTVYFYHSQQGLEYATINTHKAQEVNPSPPYVYQQDHYLGNPVPDTLNLMAPDGIGATSDLDQYATFPTAPVDEFLKFHPYIKRYGFVSQWSSLELLQGHYFWNHFDTRLDTVRLNGCNSHFAAWETPLWSKGDWTFNPPDGDTHNRTSDERWHSIFVKNLVNRYRPNGLYDQMAVGGNGDAWGNWGVGEFQFESEPNLEGHGYGIDREQVNALAEKLYRQYQMVKTIADHSYGDPCSLEVIAPNFSVLCTDTSKLSVLFMPYFNDLNNAEIFGNPNLTHVLWNYVDYLSQQMYCMKTEYGLSPLGLQDPYLPRTSNGLSSDPRRIGVEDQIWGWYTPGLDEYMGFPNDPEWQPVMAQGPEHPFFAIEWAYIDEFPESLATFENIEIDLAMAQLAENFSIDAFPLEPRMHQLMRYNCVWQTTANPYDNMYGICAQLLNDSLGRTLFTKYEVLNPFGTAEPDVYHYLFSKEGTNEYVHFLRTTWDYGIDLQNLYVKSPPGWDLNLANGNALAGARVDCYTPSGSQFQRVVSRVGSNPPFIHFAPGEIGPDIMIIHENNPAVQSGFSQGIQLRKGWNLVSWNVIPPDSTPTTPLVMSDILDPDDPVNNWFFEPSLYGQLFKHDDAQQFYPIYAATANWPWNLNHAYYLGTNSNHFWQFQNCPLNSQSPFQFTTSAAWDSTFDDSLAGYWFFMGYGVNGFTRLASIPYDTLTMTGDPNLYDYLGPFHWLIWQNDSLSAYPLGDLKIVKDDQGRFYLPQLNHFDNIGMLEPGEGYFLGFSSNSTQTYNFQGWSGYPNWQSPQPGPDNANQPGIGSPTHFQFTAYTHWSYPVIVDSVDLSRVPLEIGDEIGVFDGNLCVGAAVYEGRLPIPITTWENDIATPDVIDGYQKGHSLNLAWFDVSRNAEFVFAATPQSGLDDPSAPRSSGFGRGFYALRSLTDDNAALVPLPESFRLCQNYPNPFNSQTIIPLELPQRSNVKVELFNVQGQSVGVVFEGVQSAGWPKIRCDAANLSSGVYFYRVTAEGLERPSRFSEVRKLLLLK